eukprot:scaffold142949_cov54-Attheya_sp.AAC.1
MIPDASAAAAAAAAGVIVIRLRVLDRLSPDGGRAIVPSPDDSRFVTLRFPPLLLLLVLILRLFALALTGRAADFIKDGGVGEEEDGRSTGLSPSASATATPNSPGSRKETPARGVVDIADEDPIIADDDTCTGGVIVSSSSGSHMDSIPASPPETTAAAAIPKQSSSATSVDWAEGVRRCLFLFCDVPAGRVPGDVITVR